MQRSRFITHGQRPEDMGAQQGIYKDVVGAPFRIGDAVKVVSLSDDTADEDLLGCQGSVLYFEYSCGCGQTFPNDPMIGVQFGERTAEFWKEELSVLNKSQRGSVYTHRQRHRGRHRRIGCAAG
jgi:hypothetical protein